MRKRRNVENEKKRNPLFYLGWLGLIGILGIVYMSPWMLSCLLFFFFFFYGKMVPDELFWANVRRAGAKAFAVNIGFTLVGNFCMYVRAVSYGKTYSKWEQVGGKFLVDGRLLEQYRLGTVILVFGFIITLCTFFFFMMYYRRQERKYTEEEVC